MTAPVISAGDLVERLLAMCVDWNAQPMDDGELPRIEPHCRDLREAAARIQELESEIEAAKQFGGGFFGPRVSEPIRDIYRQQARSSLNQDGGKP